MDIRSFDITFTNSIPKLNDDIRSIDLERGVTASGTISLDAEAYERWLSSTSGAPHGALYTVTWTHDLDPNHRRVRSLRQLLRQVWDILCFEFRIAAGKPILRSVGFTLPNVRFEVGSRG